MNRSFPLLPLIFVLFFETSTSIGFKTLTFRCARRTIVTGMVAVFVSPGSVTAQTDAVLPKVCGRTQLQDFDQRGRGGTGLLFRAISQRNKPLAVKLSWPTTVSSVRHECEVLKHLETYHVEGVEKCIDSCDMEQQSSQSLPSPSQAIIVKDPFFSPPSTATLTNLPSVIQLAAVKHLTTTVIQMLLAGVATSDLQPLINPSTGDSLLIDLSEAVIFVNPKQPTDRDLQAAQNFLSEFASLVSASSVNNDQVTMLFTAARDAAHAQLQTMSPSTLSNDDGTMGEKIQPMWEGVLSRLIDEIFING